MTPPAAVFRVIEPRDIPALFAVRVRTDQNRLTREQLTSLGITERTVLTRLQTSFHGWLCEIGGQVVGFAMGDRSTGELWVIAVLPEYICRGIGSELLANVEAWLTAEGCGEFWLTTDTDRSLRAYAFYRKHGWEDWKVEGHLLYLRKRPAAAARA